MKLSEKQSRSLRPLSPAGVSFDPMLIFLSIATGRDCVNPLSLGESPSQLKLSESAEVSPSMVDALLSEGVP